MRSHGLHVRLTPRELRTKESYSLYCRCLSSLLNLHVPVTAEKKRAKQDRQTRGRKKKNQCSKRIAGFIFTDDRAVCEKFEDEHSTEIP